MSTEEQLILFAEDSPVSLSPSPAVNRVKPTSVGYGRSSPEFLARYDPDTQSWRTSQVCFLSTAADSLAEYSQTWPRSGCMRNGTAYRLPVLAHRTEGTESGLLPTATVSDAKASGAAGYSTASGWHSGTTLTDAVVRFPKSGSKVQWTLNAAVKFATPKARDYRTGDKPGSKRANNSKHTPMLNDQIAPGGQLNPTWVEWLMGFPLGWTALEPSETASSRKSSK